MRKHIFNAGPSILPETVLQEASQGVLDLNQSGMSILEISHRGSDFNNILSETKLLIRNLLGLNDNYEILFLQGGASTQFMMIPYNFLDKDSTAAYIDTGTWSSKAIKEARLFGNVEIAGSSAQSNYNHIPKQLNILNKDWKYLHLTSNNTIYGTQFKQYPKTTTSVIIDMSSDIFSKVVDSTSIDLIYAGAQKNLGPAGVTLVIIKRSLLDSINKTLPSMMDYRVHADKGSMFNTPPVFAIYVCLLTLRWLQSIGGVAAIEKLNAAKANKLYAAIDSLPIFAGIAAKEDRSFMNVTFNITDKSLEAPFLAAAKSANIEGIKGHRSVGGFRASLYNALPVESVDVLVEVMTEFAHKHG